MSEFSFLHAADIHLDSPLLSLALTEQRQIDIVRRACRDAFETLVETAIEKKVAFVILAGDLYDHDTPNMQVAVFLRNQLARLQKHDIRVFIVKGNHDADNRITSGLPLPSNTRVFSDHKAETIVLDYLPTPVAIHGQSFKAGPVTENLALSYPSAIANSVNIGVLHTSLVGDVEHDPYAPCKLEDLTSRGYDYWALGHIHKAAILSRDPWVVYPGNLQGRHAKETGVKGCAFVSVQDGRIQSVDMLDLSVVRWHLAEVDLSSAATEPELIEALRAGLARTSRDASGKPVAVRIRFVGSTALFDHIEGQPQRLMQTILEIAGEAGNDIWIEKIQNNTSPLKVESVEAQESVANLMSIIDEVIANPDSIVVAALDELSGLKAKLPDGLKNLEALKQVEDETELRETLAKLKPRLQARLVGDA